PRQISAARGRHHRVSRCPLWPLADIPVRTAHVCFWPKADIPSCTPHTPTFRGKADMTVCESPLSRSLLGVKRTWRFSLHFGPKRKLPRLANLIILKLELASLRGP